MSRYFVEAPRNPINPTVTVREIQLADGTYDVDTLKQVVEAFDLVVDDRRSSGGGLWVFNPDLRPLKEMAACVKVLLKAGFVWAEKKQGWYGR